MKKKPQKEKGRSQETKATREVTAKYGQKQKALNDYVQTLGEPGHFSDSGEITYRKVLKDKVLVAKAVRSGVPYKVWEEVKSNSFFDDNDWARLLGINVRTLQRYKHQKDFKFPTLQGERIFEVADVMSLGKSVFSESSDFYTWLNTPSYALGGAKPVEFLDTLYGIEIVKSELYAIEYGLFS